MMAHKQVLSILVDVKLADFEDVDSPIKVLNDKTIRGLIMNLQSETGDKLLIAIELSWHGELTLWEKRKFKAEAEVHASHIAA